MTAGLVPGHPAVAFGEPFELGHEVSRIAEESDNMFLPRFTVE
jgi:hypothetical protein